MQANEKNLICCKAQQGGCKHCSIMLRWGQEKHEYQKMSKIIAHLSQFWRIFLFLPYLKEKNPKLVNDFTHPEPTCYFISFSLERFQYYQLIQEKKRK